MNKWKIFLVISALACGLFFVSGNVLAQVEPQCKWIIIDADGDGVADKSGVDGVCTGTKWSGMRDASRCSSVDAGVGSYPDYACCCKPAVIIGCCKIIAGGNANGWTVDVYNISKSDCIDKESAIKDVSNYIYRSGIGINSQAHACHPEAGCCQTTITKYKGTTYRAFSSNSQTECNLFCDSIADCTSLFVDDNMPDSKAEKCIVDPNKVVKTIPPATPVGATAAVKLNPVQLTNPINADTIPAVIGNIIRSFLGIIGAIALAMFVFGGFRWLTAAGNDKSIQAGRDTILWAGIGLIIIFLSYIAVGYVMQVLGVI